MRLEDWFRAVLESYDRIAIVGGPKTGKTTLCEQVADRPVFHTDDLRSIAWADVPLAVIAAIGENPRFVVEGVQVARVLRKGLEVDLVLFLSKPKVERTAGQESMAKAVRTVLNDVIEARPDLLVEIETSLGEPSRKIPSGQSDRTWKISYDAKICAPDPKSLYDCMISDEFRVRGI